MVIGPMLLRMRDPYRLVYLAPIPAEFLDVRLLALRTATKVACIEQRLQRAEREAHRVRASLLFYEVAHSPHRGNQGIQGLLLRWVIV